MRRFRFASSTPTPTEDTTRRGLVLSSPAENGTMIVRGRQEEIVVSGKSRPCAVHR